MEIKPIDLEDLPVLLRLMRAMQDDDPWSVPFDEDRVRDAARNLLANPGFGQAWFIHDSDRVIGCRA